MKMRTFWATLIAVAGVAMTASASTPADTSKPGTTKQLKPQTVCPVMGDEIDSSVYSDIQGQRIYYCCRKCEKKVLADPDRYFKAASEAGVLFENIQKTCPVTDKPIDKRYFVDFVGRRVYFSSDTCAVLFKADPAKYLNKLDAAKSAQDD